MPKHYMKPKKKSGGSMKSGSGKTKMMKMAKMKMSPAAYKKKYG